MKSINTKNKYLNSFYFSKGDINLECVKLTEQIACLNEQIIYLESTNSSMKADYDNQINFLSEKNTLLIADLDELKTDHQNKLRELNEKNLEQLKIYESACNAVQIENDELKSQLEHSSVPKANQEEAFLEQLKQYEASFSSIQLENDELRAKLVEFSELRNQHNGLKEKHDELTSKLNTLEQLNLKYKAKLKQLLLKSKQAESLQSNSNDLLSIEEQRSSNVTPVSHSPMYHSPAFAVVKVSSTQTDLNLEELLERLAQLDAMLNELSTKLSQTHAINADLIDKNTQLEKMCADFENHFRNVDEKSQEKVENSLLLKSNEQASGSNVIGEEEEVVQLKVECQNLKERLETTQQQNLKLKAKLKTLINSNKSEKASREHSEVETSEKVFFLFIWEIILEYFVFISRAFKSKF